MSIGADKSSNRLLAALPPNEWHRWLLLPDTIFREIGHADDNSDLLDLPSIGTEEATMGRYIQLALKGHHGFEVDPPQTLTLHNIHRIK